MQTLCRFLSAKSFSSYSPKVKEDAVSRHITRGHSRDFFSKLWCFFHSSLSQNVTRYPEIFKIFPWRYWDIFFQPHSYAKLCLTHPAQLCLRRYTTIWNHKLPIEKEKVVIYWNPSSNLFSTLGCANRHFWDPSSWTVSSLYWRNQDY